MPRTTRTRGIFLRAATERAAGYISAPEREELVGREGVAVTDLHPSGVVLIGDERVDVVSDAGFVAKGSRVRIVRAEGYRLVVLPAAEAGKA
jgi:membrane-bound serine protease (ClpP class)